MIQEDLFDVAYKKLKQMVYYEKNHLFLRKRLAEFECADNFEERLHKFKKIMTNENPIETKEFQDWLKKIDFALLPKGVKIDSVLVEEHGNFVTNVTSQKHYEIGKVNYIFDGPVELHLVAVLWLMIEGSKLEVDLPRNCMGNRLHSLVGQNDDHSAHLFKKYHELYAEWRDTGIKKARDLLLDEKQSVCIIALDIQEYYYRVKVDWKELRSKINKPPTRTAFYNLIFEREIIGTRLFDCIESIFKSYREKISSELKFTHPDLPEDATCLPIGLCASPLIANWYLKEFDKAVLSEVRPSYYGRYVDDIILVVTRDSFPMSDDPIKGFMDQVLVKAEVLKWQEDNQRYEICIKPGLFLQKNKCIIQFFEANHSIAGLEKFQKEIEENASDFATLPIEGDDSLVEQVAYDILYDGSVNKFRNVKGIAENRLELAKHLSKQTQLFLVAGGGRLDHHAKKELFHFFKGRNAIEYWDLWERVIAFFVITGDEKAVNEFYAAVKREITRMIFKESKRISHKLQNSLGEHLDISRELSKALRDSNYSSKSDGSGLWRHSNMIRHHLVAVPLLNFTNFTGDLAFPSEVVDVILDYNKIKQSPRFVHFDECLGLIYSGFIANTENDPIMAANEMYVRFHSSKLEDVESIVVTTSA